MRIRYFASLGLFVVLLAVFEYLITAVENVLVEFCGLFFHLIGFSFIAVGLLRHVLDLLEGLGGEEEGMVGLKSGEYLAWIFNVLIDTVGE